MLIDELPALMPWIESCDHLQIECASLRTVCEDATNFIARLPSVADTEEGRLLLRRPHAAVGSIELCQTICTNGGMKDTDRCSNCCPTNCIIIDENQTEASL